MRYPPFRRAVTEPLGAFFKPPLEVGVGDLPERNCIIEVHGKQHYLESDFSAFGGRTYIEEQLNDQYKKELAVKNNIENYIVIQNIKSNKENLRINILQSILTTLLDFSDKDINWDSCHEFCMTNKTKLICDYYENNEKDLNKIAKYFKNCKNTIRKHLEDGALIGLCSYNPDEARKSASKISVEKMMKSRCRPVLQISKNGQIIKEYPSLNEAQRQFNTSKILDCVKGRKHSFKGYRWIYKEEFELESQKYLT